MIGSLKDFKNTGKTVAYFFVNTDGTVIVRSSSDYIPKMIDIAGGKYIFQDLKNTKSKSASVELSMEEFYAKAKNADYLIYNASIDSSINSIADLTAKSELFADFKAVKNGNVWCTGKSLYQATDIVGNLITDINLMLTDGDESGMTFLYRVKSYSIIIRWAFGCVHLIFLKEKRWRKRISGGVPDTSWYSGFWQRRSVL